MPATTALAQGQPKRDICHRDGEKFIPISVADPAWDAHVAHGDCEVGDGYDENCQPLQIVEEVYVVDIFGYHWDLDPDSTGEWSGHIVNVASGLWPVTGTVTPPFFDAGPSSTMSLTTNVLPIERRRK